MARTKLGDWSYISIPPKRELKDVSIFFTRTLEMCLGECKNALCPHVGFSCGCPLWETWFLTGQSLCSSLRQSVCVSQNCVLLTSSIFPRAESQPSYPSSFKMPSTEPYARKAGVYHTACTGKDASKANTLIHGAYDPQGRDNIVKYILPERCEGLHFKGVTEQ